MWTDIERTSWNGFKLDEGKFILDVRQSGEALEQVLQISVDASSL